MKKLLMITMLVSAVSIQAKLPNNNSKHANIFKNQLSKHVGGNRSSIPPASRPKYDLLQALGGAIKALPRKDEMSIKARNDLVEAERLARESDLKEEYLKGAVDKAISQLNKVAKMRKSESDSRVKLTKSIDNLKEALRNL